MTVKTFLNELAHFLLEQHSNNLDRVTLVLPGRRTGIYLKKELRAAGYRNGWLPAMRTLSEVLADMSDTARADKLDLLFELYELWRQRFEPNESFSEFLQWGPTILSDFNEIDHYRLDARQVFRNLKAYKEIEQWSFGEDEDEWSEVQQDFSRFWDRLLPLYEVLQERMFETGQFYGGAIARKTAENPIPGFERLHTDHLIVAGLSALTPAEQTVLKKLEDAGKAAMIWDADRYYVDDRPLEAGHFMRQMRQGGINIEPKAHFLSTRKNITLAGCSSTITQTQYVHEVLKNTDTDKALETAVILPDNSVLPALLPALPEKFKSINVTMGKQLAHTPVRSLFHHAFRLFDMKGSRLRHTEATQLLRHPMLSGADAPHRAFFNFIQRAIVRRNEVFMSREVVDQLTREFIDSGGEVAPQVNEFVSALFETLKTRGIGEILHVLDRLMHLCEPPDNLKELHQAWILSTGLIQRLQRMHDRYPVLENARDIERILLSLLSQAQIDLIGEPLEGLQVMGLLESRALDFKRVILLNCNEGVLPKTSFGDSFLPAVIRRGFRLPTPFDRDAIFAYYTYRLLQRAEEVHLVYTAGESSFKSGEKSRYLQQLESCPILAAAESTITHRNVLSEAPLSQPSVPALQLGEWSVKRFEELKHKGLSPSGLNKWIDCPNNFYHRHVLGFREQDDIEEEIEHSTLGNIVHKAVEEGYGKYMQRSLRTEDLKMLKGEVKDLVDKALDEAYRKDLTYSGVNYISKAVARKFVEKVFSIDEQLVKAGKNVQIESLEADMRREADTEGALFGFADRIDRVDGALRIVDFKTGKVTPAELKLNADSWQEELVSGKKGKVLQTLVYAWLCRQLHPEPVVSGIISTRSHRSGFLPVTMGKSTLVFDDKFESDFEDWLKGVFNEIGVVQQRIEHTEDAPYCEYCVTLKA